MAFTRAFLGTKATLQTSISGVRHPLWVSSVDGFPSLYEGSLAEMDEAWECTDIDFFIPMHTLMYWLLYRSVRDILFANVCWSWKSANRILSDWVIESKAILISFHWKAAFFFGFFSGVKIFTLTVFVSLKKKSWLFVHAMMTTNVIILRGVWVRTVGLLYCIALTVIYLKSAARV